MAQGFKLIIAEKPSVARDIAKALKVPGRGRGYLGSQRVRISWCVGHLAELAEPAHYRPEWKSWRLDTLPMLPERFKLNIRDSARDQWEVVRDLLQHEALLEVVNACDAGREGELIFAQVYELAGCRAPVRRLWIAAMTDSAIKDGFKKLKDGTAYHNLEAAARCRSEADWLVGLNATRAMTTRLRMEGGEGLLTLGRVQTPTLSILGVREREIQAFVSHDFHEVKILIVVPEEGALPPSVAAASWEGVWMGSDPAPEGIERDPGKPDYRIWDRARAEAILDRVKGRRGEVTVAEHKEVPEKPPLLYDLTTLQKEANRRFGFSAQKTLELAQALYERHKVITYPRTDSRHLGQEHTAGLKKLVHTMKYGPYAPAAESILTRWPIKLGSRVVDDEEVSDHHAIIPTGTSPVNLALNPEELQVLDLVQRRFLAVFMPPARFATSRIWFDVAHEEHRDRFFARGRSCLELGWRSVDPPQSKKKEKLLPGPVKGCAGEVQSGKIRKGSTKPPKRFNDAGLLAAMERAGEVLEDAELKRAMKRNGLGTPATRASVIETLLQRGFVVREKGGNLVPSAQGLALLDSIPVPALRSPQLTGRWEARLVAISEGRDSRQDFMEDIRSFTTEMVETIQQTSLGEELRLTLARNQKLGAVLGECPRCGDAVREAERGWLCPGCALSIPSRMASRPLARSLALELLQDGRTAILSGFTSRDGKPFEAALMLTDQGQVRFDFSEVPSEQPSEEELGAVVGSCPLCQSKVHTWNRGWSCSGCDLLIPLQVAKRPLDEPVVQLLLQERRTPPLLGFLSRSGKPFEAALVLTPQGKLEFQFRQGEILGPCPACEQPVREGPKAYSCDGDRSCAFVVFKEMSSRAIQPEEVKQLLLNGVTEPLTGFTSRAGKSFEAALMVDPSDGKVRFQFSDGPSLGDCPACGAAVRHRSRVYSCDRGRECSFVVFGTMSDRAIQPEEVQQLLQEGETAVLEGFRDRDGYGFKGQLCWVSSQQRVRVRSLEAQGLPVLSAPCPRCQGPVRGAEGRGWSCGQCGLEIPPQFHGRRFIAAELQRLLERGRSYRLHGFRGSGGVPIKAACELSASSSWELRLDYRKKAGDEDPPLPPGAHPPALGGRIPCPACLDRGEPRPGYILAGRSNWGCSHWHQGCRFVLPFVIVGKDLQDSPDEVRRLLKKDRATRYLKEFKDESGAPLKHSFRVALEPLAEPCWRLERRGRGSTSER